MAAILGGQRVPSSGNGQIKGDVRHDRFLIECKYGKQVPVTVYNWMEEAIRDAATEGKTRGSVLAPLLVLMRPRARPLVVLDLDHFADLLSE